MSFDYTLKGRRIRLDHCDDRYTHLTPGALGTIDFMDDMGTLHVHWDSGSQLGLVPAGGDRWTVLPTESTP